MGTTPFLSSHDLKDGQPTVTQAPGPDVRKAPISVGPGYEMLGELGRGGMGAVYKARQVALNRTVALKVVLSGGYASDRERARFLREAEAVAALNHPGIVGVYEFGTWDGQPYLALEYCPGGNLTQKLSGTPIAPGEAAALVRTLARAVQAAHDRGIVHRDLKPQNILLTAAGEPKVADFGLAKVADSGAGLTATEAVMGTPSYMAPEQARGETKAVGPHSDVYALGAILYECLTGRPPFKAASPAETLVQVIHQEPASVRALNPNVPTDLATIVHKCLEKDFRARYHAAAALAEDLGRFLGGAPVLSRFSAAANIVIMFGAIEMAHGKNGFFLSNQGFEYNLALIGLFLPTLLAGPGRYAVGRYLPLPKSARTGRPVAAVE